MTQRCQSTEDADLQMNRFGQMTNHKRCGVAECGRNESTGFDRRDLWHIDIENQYGKKALIPALVQCEVVIFDGGTEG